MARLRPYALGAAIAALGFLCANGVAVATTGHPLVLGHSNSANAVTSLKRTTSGPALKLISKAGSPALGVSNTKKIARLNADSVDGASAPALKNNLYRYTPPDITDDSSASMSFPGLPAGRYLASYTMAEATDSTSANVDCGFFQSSPGFELVDRATTFDDLAIVTGSGTIDTRSEEVTFVCLSNGNFHWYIAQPNFSSVTFLRVDKVVKTAATSTKKPVAHASRGTSNR